MANFDAKVEKIIDDHDTKPHVVDLIKKMHVELERVKVQNGDLNIEVLTLKAELRLKA